MDLQNKLTNALVFFTKQNLKNPRVYIYPPRNHNLFHYCIVIEGIYAGKSVKGSSSGKNLLSTFLKALSEMGENIICDEYGMDCRSGIAGGFVRQNCIIRAKAELIERDAFLFHYRNKIPFHRVHFQDHFLHYKLNSCVKSYHVSFVMDPEYLSNEKKCLIFGMGCDLGLKPSFDKAMSEYSTMYLNHELFPCGEAKSNFPENWTCKADFHHSQSRSGENKSIFKELCSGKVVDIERNLNQELWTVKDLISPFRFVEFVKVSHPQLEKLQFGKPEDSFSFTNPVYHPFW